MCYSQKITMEYEIRELWNERKYFLYMAAEVSRYIKGEGKFCP